VPTDVERALSGLYLIYSFALMAGGPLALLVWLGRLLIAGQRGARDGLLWGVVVAAWASLALFTIPYCGLYACLPGIAILIFLHLDLTPAWVTHAFLMGSNFVIWPALGWVMFAGKQGVRALVGKARGEAPPRDVASP
jgi:hypothetical protein